MTTPPPDTQAPNETLRQIAERIVRETILVEPGKIADRYIDAIEAALRDEQEHAAKILDGRVMEISNYQTRPYRVARRELEAAARAIREGL